MTSIILLWVKKNKLLFYELMAVPLILLILAGLYYSGKHAGKEEAAIEFETKAKIALEKANEKYRKLEDQHANRVEEYRLAYARQTASNSTTDLRVSTSLASGSSRLRVRASRCPSVPATRTAAARIDGPTTCELPPEIGKRLYDLAADADATARQLEALQQWANSAVILGTSSR